jgi:hypothetical protein
VSVASTPGAALGARSRPATTTAATITAAAATHVPRRAGLPGVAGVAGVAGAGAAGVGSSSEGSWRKIACSSRCSAGPGSRPCNGTHTTGCGGHFPTAATGRGPIADALDARTGRVYVTDFSGAAVTILNGARCNADVTSGCGTATERAVGSVPLGLALDQSTHTVYVTQLFHGGSLSIVKAG